MKKILFVTWDSPHTNYLQTLFLPIFCKLIKCGHQFSVLQFSWADDEQIQNTTELCNSYGINYRHIKVLRKPSVALGSLLSVLKGKYVIRKAIKDWGSDTVMPRSTLPALSTMLAIKKSPHIRMIFDADGLPLDERVDFSNSSPVSLVHRFLRDVETQAVIRASAVITRSKIASKILQNRAGAGTTPDKFTVVSNGRPDKLFYSYPKESRLRIRTLLGVNHEAPLIVYAGSLGPQYCIENMIQFFTGVKKYLPQAKFLVLSSQHDEFQKVLTNLNLSNDGIIFKTLSANQVGEYLSACDIGLAIREPSFSMQGVAPIKIGEYLMCGLPVVATQGIGDTDMVTNDIGYLLAENNSNSIAHAVKWFILKFEANDVNRTLNTKIGVSHFSIDSSVQLYIDAFERE